MSEDNDARQQRRRFLKLVGGGAVMMPAMALTACSGGKDEAPATPKAGEAPAMDASPKPSGMPRLSEDDPQAKAMSYVHDASSLSTETQPRYKAGQVCSNCALFQGKADAEWGGCSIFAGKAVAGPGWCSVYAPKPS